MLVLSSESAGTHTSRSGYDHYYLDINARCGTPVQDLVCGPAAQCGRGADAEESPRHNTTNIANNADGKLSCSICIDRHGRSSDALADAGLHDTPLRRPGAGGGGGGAPSAGPGSVLQFYNIAQLP